jgi:hypothetical protein
MISLFLTATLFFTSQGNIINLDLVKEIVLKEVKDEYSGYAVGMLIGDHVYWHRIVCIQDLENFFIQNFKSPFLINNQERKVE